MFFYVQGPNKHDLMPLERIFDKRIVNKTDGIKKSQTVAPRQFHDTGESYQHQLSSEANTAYQTIDRLPDDRPALFASQIMTFPVDTLMADTSIDHAITLFKSRQLRHLPVVSMQDKVIGMLSDRDIMQYMTGLLLAGQASMPPPKAGNQVEQLMQYPVLTAVGDTDIRYIARLFVERRIGAMPIVADGKLTGIISRSDILQAVMSHYEIELWI